MRISGWEQRVTTLMWDFQSTKFDWELHNCVIASGRIADAIDQQGYILQHVGKFDSQLSAYKYIKSLGVESVGDLPAMHYERCSLSGAERGDVVVINDPVVGELLGNYFEGFVYAVTQNGFAKYPVMGSMQFYKVE